MAAPGEEGSARNFLCLIGDGDAAPRVQRPGQQQREEIEQEVEVELGLSLGGMFPVEMKRDKLPRSSAVTAVQTPPMEVPATPAVQRASGSPSYASSEGGQRLQDSVPPVVVPAPAPLALPRASWLAVQAEEQAARLPASGSPSSASLKRDGLRLQGTIMRTSSVPAVTEAAGNIECNKRKETQNAKRLEINNKMIESRNSTPSTSKEVSKDPAKRRRGRPPKYQATTLTSQGTTVTEESSSSSVPSSSKATRRVTAASRQLPPSSLAPRTAVATLDSSRDQGILAGSAAAAAAATANSTGDEVGRRLMQEMPGVHTRDLPNGNRVDGFLLYKFRQAGDVRIICLCHGSFFTPSEFVEHAGAGKVDNPLRHISVDSPTQTP